MPNTSANKELADLEPQIKRVAGLAKARGMTLSIVSRCLVLQGEGAMIIAPMPRSYYTWCQLGDWPLYEWLYSRSYRRRSADYGEENPIAAKSWTRNEIYAKWDSI